MKKESRLKKFELHHKIIFFLLIMVVTILITRVLVFIKDPAPTLIGFEFHHFDYGLALLLITVLLILFGRKHDLLYLVLSAVSFGLIIDDLWFIRSKIVQEPVAETIIYNSTLPSVIILAVVIVLILLLIRTTQKNQKTST